MTIEHLGPRLYGNAPASPRRTLRLGVRSSSSSPETSRMSRGDLGDAKPRPLWPGSVGAPAEPTEALTAHHQDSCVPAEWMLTSLRRKRTILPLRSGDDTAHDGDGRRLRLGAATAGPVASKIAREACFNCWDFRSARARAVAH